MKQSTFADLGVNEKIVRALSDRGIESPLPVQGMVIPDVLDGRDVLAKSPTGSGKTLAFGIPMVQNIQAGASGGAPSGLVLAPTRELASQIVDELETIARSKNLNVVAVYGGAGISQQIKRSQKADILVATPGRLVDLIERRAVNLKHVDLLVLDEADRMLDMGFKPVVERLVAMTPDDRQTLLFSATLDGAIGQIAKQFTRDAVRHEHEHAPEQQGKIEHRFLRVAHAAKTDALVAELRLEDRGRTLVFVRTKRGADRLAKKLASHDMNVAAMHGDKSQSQREKALARFESGHIDTLIATDVAARGIDVAEITHVINFDVPGATEDYVHRVGRTARAGASGVGITFVVEDQARDIARMGNQLGLQAELAEAGIHSNSAPRGAKPGGGSRGGHNGNRGRSRSNGNGNGRNRGR